MVNNVFKTEEGEEIIKNFTTELYKSNNEYNFNKVEVETTAGKANLLQIGDINKPIIFMLHGTMSNSATWLLDIFNELNIQKASLITMSLGSWYGLNFATLYPEKIKSMSMLTTSGIFPAKVSFIFKAIFFMMLGAKGQKLLNKAIFYKTPTVKDVMFVKYNEYVSKYFKPMLEPIPIFTDERLKKIDFPIQYFGGDKDVLLNSIETGKRMIKHVPQAKVNILKETGLVIIDKFDDIQKFLLDI
ncbi:MAG: alpha/beta hydrolase [Spirochaetaceae bacterium]